jgi:hypothetical protein
VYAVIYLIIKQIRKNSAECWVSGLRCYFYLELNGLTPL